MANENNKNEKKKIEVQPIDFQNTLESFMTTTMDLSSKINNLFNTVFHDYEGCNIRMNPQRGWELSLYFRDHGTAEDGKFKSITSTIGNKPTKGSDIMERIQALNMINNAKNIGLNQDTREMLAEFFDVRPGTEPNWKQLTAEVTENTYNGQLIYMKVFGLNLYRVIKKMYGSNIKMSDGSKHQVDYNIVMNRVLGGTGDNQNYLITIQRLDNNVIAELCKNVGLMPSNGNISMVR